MKIRNNQQLCSWIQQGHRASFIFFWGHQKPKTGVNKSCFSQWFESGFTDNGLLYRTAEHFMMAEKARLFDIKLEQQILEAKTPDQAKKLGRKINNFDNSVWEKRRFDIVVKANLLKFGQNKALEDFLLATGNYILVEASPMDKIWGIGLAADHQHVENPSKWDGLNLLGYALMEVRSQLVQKAEE